jgi:hypothetical protein
MKMNMEHFWNNDRGKPKYSQNNLPEKYTRYIQFVFHREHWAHALDRPLGEFCTGKALRITWNT